MFGKDFMNNSIKQSSVLVIGDVILDHYVLGSCERISPEAPVPVVDFMSEDWVLGGAANVANNLSSLGIDTTLAGVVGEDEHGMFIEQQLSFKKISNLLVKSNERSTTTKTRIISGGQQLLRLDREKKSEINTSEQLEIIDKIKLSITNFDCIIISDYNKGLMTDSLTNTLITIANHAGVKVLVDPKNPPFSKFLDAYLIKPNRKEAYNETGIYINDIDSFEKAAKVIQNKTNCKVVVITLSEDGLGYFDNGKVGLIPTQAKKIFDVTGAGDTFIASLAYAILLDKSILDSCYLANHAAGIVVSRQGCVPILYDDIKTII
jgi:D-beta-D-heptose 7-phosphate kinase/D-beta-D-heptose 1-phosphate adenosyltransferase